MTHARQHRIAEKLRVEYVAQIGYKPGGAEFASWQNSLTALALVIDQAELTDHGVILEYQLGNTSRRLDAMLTGHAPSSDEHAVVIELKQWGETAASNADGCVETFVGQRLRPVPHPSVQVGQYEQWLLDNHTVFYEDGVSLAGVSWLHNMQFDPADELFAPKHAEYLATNPLFTGDQSDVLAEFLPNLAPLMAFDLRVQQPAKEVANLGREDVARPGVSTCHANRRRERFLGLSNLGRIMCFLLARRGLRETVAEREIVIDTLLEVDLN